MNQNSLCLLGFTCGHMIDGALHRLHHIVVVLIVYLGEFGALSFVTLDRLWSNRVEVTNNVIWYYLITLISEFLRVAQQAIGSSIRTHYHIFYLY